MGIGLALLACASLGSAGCSEPAHAEPPADTRVPVELAKVGVGPVDRPIVAPATLRAKRDYDLAFQVQGVVRDIRVDVGQRVRKGQVLAAIDPTTFLAGLSQAREGRDKASRDRERAEVLGRSGAIPQALLDDARTQSTLAEASLSSARYLASTTVLVAPEDGFVDGRDVELGEVVAPGRPVLRVKGLAGGWIAVTDVVDRDAVAVRPGTRARVHLDALPDRPFEGLVSRVALSASRGTGTFEVEIALEDDATLRARPAAAAPRGEGEAAPLLSGLTGRVAIERRVDVAARVPLSAVVAGDADRGALYVVEGGKARRRDVRIAFLAGAEVALRDRIDAGEVVARGAEHLADGLAVRVVASEPSGAGEIAP